MAVAVGCDVGGTFTDLILLDRDSGLVKISKVPTTPEDQSGGFMAALRSVDVAPAGIEVLVHGTTTTTNALLERKVARTGLITTKGFRDILELGRRTRPNAYGMLGRFEPLIERQDRLEVTERMDAQGRVLQTLDEAAVAEAVEQLLAQGCESLVIHFLHSYANPLHEQRAYQIATELWPNSFISLGSAILAEYREYERGTAAAVNAAVQPVLQRYVMRLRDALAEAGYGRELLVMQGNGGTVSAGMVAETAINTVMSGPASGVIAAAHVGRGCGIDNLITYDMGGTSSDVGLIQDALPTVSSELQLEYGMPVHVPMVDVHTIGAGGGSIAWLDDAGMLQVGPQSAGAVPGPICYGRGGTEPTITDANLLLGRLNPNKLVSVAQKVSMADIAERIETRVGTPLGLGSEAAAAAILRIANDRMAGAIRMVSLARGHDPRDFTLMAFGGAGPLHACALAAELAIPHVLVPGRPGITNAIGCLVADLRHDFVRTINRPLAELEMASVTAVLQEQIDEGRARIGGEDVAVDAILTRHVAEMQFQGQSHMLRVAIDSVDMDRDALQAAFEKAYFERFRLRLPEGRAILVNVHTAVIGRRPEIPLDSLMDASLRAESLHAAQADTRRVWFKTGWQANTPIYDRSRLPLGATFDGPAILEQLDTTIVIEPGNAVRVDEMGNLRISVTATQAIEE